MKATCEGGIADGRTVEIPDDREHLAIIDRLTGKDVEEHA